MINSIVPGGSKIRVRKCLTAAFSLCGFCVMVQEHTDRTLAASLTDSSGSICRTRPWLPAHHAPLLHDARGSVAPNRPHPPASHRRLHAPCLNCRQRSFGEMSTPDNRPRAQQAASQLSEVLQVEWLPLVMQVSRCNGLDILLDAVKVAVIWFCATHVCNCVWHPMGEFLRHRAKVSEDASLSTTVAFRTLCHFAHLLEVSQSSYPVRTRPASVTGLIPTLTGPVRAFADRVAERATQSQCSYEGACQVLATERVSGLVAHASGQCLQSRPHRL